MLTGTQCDADVAVFIHVAVYLIVGSLIRGGEFESRRSHNAHSIVSRWQTGETEPAGRQQQEPICPETKVRTAGRHALLKHTTRLVQQRDGRVGQSRFSRVLHAVAVQVMPNVIANRPRALGGEHHPRSRHVLQLLICGQCHLHAAVFIHVAIRCLVSPLIGRAEDKPLRSRHPYGVRPGRQARESVVAAARCLACLGVTPARDALQHDGHVVQPRFACVLDPVLVEIVPYAVGYFAPRRVPNSGIARVFHFATGGGERYGHAAIS